MTNLLIDVVQEGTGKKQSFNYLHLAGKTSTAQKLFKENIKNIFQVLLFFFYQ